jgi:hypothetical protein
LNTTTSTIPTSPRQIPPIGIRCIRTITAANIVKAERPVCDRAGLAVHWMKHLLDIEKRTGAMASVMFGCSAGAISRELAAWMEPKATIAELLVHYWQKATDQERADFGKVVGDDLWERAIVPNL